MTAAITYMVCMMCTIGANSFFQQFSDPDNINAKSDGVVPDNNWRSNIHKAAQTSTIYLMSKAE